MGSNGHAILPPSSASEWGNCDAWLTLNRAAPVRPDGDEAIWGTECHALAEQMLQARQRGVAIPANGHDPEQYECAKMYADHCGDLMAKHSIFGGVRLGVEQPVKMSRVSDDVWGTPDFFLYSADTFTLYVRDLKTGRLLCEPDCDQLVLYAVGVMELLGLDDQTLMLDLGIVQPRGFHSGGPIRTVRMRASDIRGRVNQLSARAERNQRPDPEATAGAHCYNCNARTRCPAALALGPKLLQLSTEGVPVEPTAAEVGQLLTWTRRAIKFLGQMEKAYEGELESHLRAGVIVPGWALVESTGREYWTAERDDILKIGELFGVSLDKPDIITPAQARKAGIPKEIVENYCTRRQNGTTLKEQDGKNVSKIFNNKPE